MILLNSIKCNNCKEIIISKTQHDFNMCSCGQCGIDGGRSYIRRIGIDYIDYSLNISLEEFYDNPELSHFLMRECLFWGRNYDKNMNKLPATEYIPIKDLTSDHIEAILKTQIHLSEFWKSLFKRELQWRK